MKKLIGAGIGIALLFATAVPTFAASCRNKNTGRSSVNTCTATVNKTSTITVNNNGSVVTELTSTVTTGGNTANNNTGGGSIKTGNATANISVNTVMNQTVLNISQ